VPPRGGRYGRQFRRPAARDTRTSDRIQFERRTVPRPAAPAVLVAVGGGGGATDRWELVCRDGWEWREVKPGQVAVRVAPLSADQAQVVQDWLTRLKQPTVWWAVSRELNSEGSSPEVGQAMAANPWLSQVLPVLLEASTEGAPPPPPPGTRGT
jgi:hypothetical protein